MPIKLVKPGCWETVFNTHTRIRKKTALYLRYQLDIQSMVFAKQLKYQLTDTDLRHYNIPAGYEKPVQNYCCICELLAKIFLQ